MTLTYKGEKYENVRAVGFNMSNELGCCVTMVQEVKAPKDNPALNNRVTVLELVEIGKLKIQD